MTERNHRTDLAPHSSLDRRTLLRRVAQGAAITGAMVATSQIVQSSPVHAACSPVTKLLQVNPANCMQIAPTTNPTSGQPPTCVTTNWVAGQSDTVGYTCPNTYQVNITDPECDPVQAWAVKSCLLASGIQVTCVPGTISGDLVTFPTFTAAEVAQNCVYLDYRIELDCCVGV